jgi:hypothetical protein
MLSVSWWKKLSRLIERIGAIPLDFYVGEVRECGSQDFLSTHQDSDFLVSHGPIKRDNPMETMLLAFKTSSGGSLVDLARSVHEEGSVVYEIPWDNIDWNSPAFRMRKVWVGRAPNLALQLVHGNVSKTHGYFTNKRGEIFYADIGSTNGSKVNNKRIRPLEDTAVLSGDILNVGSVKLTSYSAKDFLGILETMK